MLKPETRTSTEMERSVASPNPVALVAIDVTLKKMATG